MIPGKRHSGFPDLSRATCNTWQHRRGAPCPRRVLAGRQAVPSPVRRPTILVIDREREVNQMLHAVRDSEGYYCLTALNLDSAVHPLSTVNWTWSSRTTWSPPTGGDSGGRSLRCSSTWSTQAPLCRRHRRRGGTAALARRAGCCPGGPQALRPRASNGRNRQHDPRPSDLGPA